MSESDPEAFDPAFLEDFYSESDDHLTQIRTELGALTSSTPLSPARTQSAWESILRNLHSLKGIIAIVGLRDAEKLSHIAEDCVRPWARGKSTPAPESIALLDAAAHRLEQVVSHHRQGRPLPSSEDLQQKLSASTHANTGVSSRADSPSPPHPSGPWAPPPHTAPTAMSSTSWRVLYRPTAERDARGINLSSVRARLLKLGELVRTTPSVEPGGGLHFEFILSAKTITAEQIAAWREDGLEFSPEVPVNSLPPPVDQHTDDELHEADDPTGNLYITPSHLVRVDMGRLDELMRITGELVIQRSKFEDALEQTDFSGKPRFQEINTRLNKSLRDLREALTRVRMVPIAEIFTRLPFVVRDLSVSMKKRVQLRIEGQHTEIDKHLVERLKEPLLHLIRNALSHGIETPAERERAGKPVEASLLLRATQVGPSILIELRDDGRGIDQDRVVSRARALGVQVSEPVTNDRLLDLLCVSGLSTREEADLISGKGVGMAVVRNAIQGIGGTLRLETRKGQSTHFSLYLPLTLSITEAIIVSVGTQRYAVPRGYIQEIIQHPSNDLRRVQETTLLPYRNELIPLISLQEYFRQPASISRELTTLIIITEHGPTAVSVDKVHGQREVVVRSLHDPLVRVKGIGGATELGDGKPLLILDVAALAADFSRLVRSSSSQSTSLSA